jgi:cysteinyl-tRNA synthetase
MRFDAMDLKLYDTLTREKRIFKPLDPANVRMYVCGPTVYDFAHIGNARPVIVFDVLFRLLRHIYGAEHVTYVRNITDVDDKINARAAEEYPDLPLNEAIRKVTEKTDRQFHEDVAALGCLPPTIEPRATEHIVEMRALIDRLVASGNAYVAEDNVLFSVPSMPDYGRLSKRPLDEMIAGARIEVAPYKRDAMDFVLWKPSKPGEPAWPSPAGIKTSGRPGWHIECSAMSWKHLGEEFDIHGGGIDLVFPHHENEIAQSRCAFHTPVMANYWMHNGFLQVEGEKMSKSLGNFVTIHELLDSERFGGREWPGPVLRFAMLKTHYRQPIDWTVRGLEEAESEYESLLDTARDFASENIDAEILNELTDDLNTPSAIARLFALRGAAMRGDTFAGGALRASLGLIGVDDYNPDRGGLIISPPSDNRGAFPPRTEEDVLADMLDLFPRNYLVRQAQVILDRTDWKINFGTQLNIFRNVLRYHGPNLRVGEVLSRIAEVNTINKKLEERLEARKAKKFKESDRIRDELAAMGIVLKDTKDGTTWEIAR